MLHSIKAALLGGLLVVGLSGCESLETAEDTLSQTHAEFGDWGVETRYMDRQIAPGEDFYRYVNAGWLDTAQIPDGLPLNGSFVQLSLQTEQQLQTIVDSLPASKADPGTPEQQVADLYASYVGIERRNAQGMAPVQSGVDAALAVSTRGDVARLMGEVGYDSIFATGVAVDSTNPDQYRLNLVQSGLGLPGRTYYLNDGEPYVILRTAYLDYVHGVLARAGVSAPASRAKDVVAFETALAEAHWPPERAREAILNNHHMAVSALPSFAPGFDWPAFLAAGGLDEVDNMNLRTDSAIKASAVLFAKTPLRTLRAYLVFHYLNNYAPYLSEEWDDAHFDFYARKLGGIRQPRSREKRALDFINQVAGEQMGRLYVERYFPPEAKAEMVELVTFVQAAFRQRLKDNTWMDAATQTEALAKLDAFTAKIGYPDRWHDISDLTIRRDDLVGNLNRIQRWQQRDSLKKLGETVRRWEWEMTPQTVNAYYNPSANEIVFPAAILQPPFFDPVADPAVNFGGIGMVIGHETGHGFDDQGSRYDGTGALRNWWSDASRERFDAMANRLVAQFDRFEPLEGVNVNGRLTLGENLGDLGGATVAYDAWRRYAETRYGGEPPVIDGFSGDQRFFLGFAQIWRTRWHDESLRRALLTDPHSPGEYRVNGTLRNVDAWYEAFNVGPDAPHYLAPDQRVHIW